MESLGKRAGWIKRAVLLLATKRREGLLFSGHDTMAEMMGEKKKGAKGTRAPGSISTIPQTWIAFYRFYKLRWDTISSPGLPRSSWKELMFSIRGSSHLRGAHIGVRTSCVVGERSMPWIYKISPTVLLGLSPQAITSFHYVCEHSIPWVKRSDLMRRRMPTRRMLA